MRKFTLGQPRDRSTNSRLDMVENNLQEIERASHIPDDGMLTLVRKTSVTWDPANLITGASDTKIVTAKGAQAGDLVKVSFSLPLQGVLLTGEVTADNEVTATAYNPTGGAVNLGSGTLGVWVQR